MRRLANDLLDSPDTDAVSVVRWETYPIGDALPFRAMWYLVPPGDSPPSDCHPEVELSVVVRGTATVEASGELTAVPAGSAFLLDSFESHIVHNASPETPLVVFSAYWLPDPGADPDRGRG